MPGKQASGSWVARVPAKASSHSEARGSAELEIGLRLIGVRVATLRAERGLTQEQLAEAASLDAKHVQDVEHGRSNLTVATLLGLARGLGVKVVDLVREI